MESSVVQILKALSDETRLRILGVLHKEPLSVNELLQVLEMGQSRVSRHLKILADAGILEGRREGSRVYYGLAGGVAGSSVLSGLLRVLGMDGITENGEEHRNYLPSAMVQDGMNLAMVLEARKNLSLHHFQMYGQDQDRLQQGLVDSSYYRRKIVEMLPDDSGVTVDLGCGTGELARMLLERAPRVILVDQSQNMLDRAREAISPRRAEFRLGSLEHLPLRDGEADTIVASMVLHHMPDPMTGLLEMRRVLREGGLLIVSDLLHHDREVMRNRFADFWLGFERDRLIEYITRANFVMDGYQSGRGEGELECLFFAARGTGQYQSGSSDLSGEKNKKRKIVKQGAGSRR